MSVVEQKLEFGRSPLSETFETSGERKLVTRRFDKGLSTFRFSVFRAIELITSDRPFTIICYQRSSARIPGYDILEYEVLRIGSRWCCVTNSYIIDDFQHCDLGGEMAKDIAKLRSENFANKLFYPSMYSKIELNSSNNLTIHYMDVVDEKNRSIYV